jgi:hypothetical protein
MTIVEKFVDRAERDARLAKLNRAKFHIHKFTDTLPPAGIVWCLAYSPKKGVYGKSG